MYRRHSQVVSCVALGAALPVDAVFWLRLGSGLAARPRALDEVGERRLAAEFAWSYIHRGLVPLAWITRNQMKAL